MSGICDRLNLPTPEQVYQENRFKPVAKPSESRAAKKGADDKDDQQLLKAWRRKVWKRDEATCRCCGKNVIKTLENLPERGECHHIEGRATKATRYDVRNGALICNSPCHERVTGAVGGHKLLIVGRRFFHVDGSPEEYIDATFTLTFKRIG